MFACVDRILNKNKVYAISIGSNAHQDKLGYHAETESINALKGANRSIEITFKIDANGNPYDVRATT